MKTEQDLKRLAHKYTTLNDDEIEYLIDCMDELVKISQDEGVDVFINIIRENNVAETISSAYAHSDHSAYDISTVGYIIREVDEPSMFGAIWFDREAKDVVAVSYTNTSGNMIVQHSTPIKYKGKIVGVMVRERPLTPEEKNSYNNLKNQWHPTDSKKYPYLRNLDILAECTDEAVIILNQEGTVVYRNLNAVNIYYDYGYLYDILGRKYDDISMHGPIQSGIGREKAFHKKEQLCKGKYYQVREYCYFNEEYFHVILISKSGQNIHNEKNLVHKSFAFREAHHRIKNNLQTVHNLLEMQHRRLNDGDAAMALQDAMYRIMSISTSYESLLTRDADTLNLKEMVISVTNKFVSLVESSPLDINIDIRGDEFDVDADISTNIALIINELLQNSFKYAFREKDKGHIEIKILERPLYSTITVSDNGTGFSKPSVKNTKNTMGLQIVKSIVESKLEGNLDIQTGTKGTTVKFDFKTHKK